ncbi:MAG TPA: hypothetical protein PKV21_06390 [bacterium]|nr:hypothetical protein [bacterium]HOM27117.1 hypothetical protein [bacterium]
MKIFKEFFLFSVLFIFAGQMKVISQSVINPMDEYLKKWEIYIINVSKSRYCDKEMGEEIGWLVSPFLNGFYYGYMATEDTKWIDMLIDWTDSLLKRAIKEPDGYIGWPKKGSGGSYAGKFYTDSLLGEAMVFCPVVKMSKVILETPLLKEKYGKKAEEYIKLAEKIFEKWDKRGCWRETKAGGVWVVPPFGIDETTGKWTEGYERKEKDGFTNPANKQNYIAQYLIALYDCTGKPVYKERAEKWFKEMKSRMKLREGKYYVWNYWDPAGEWDYNPDGSPKHWIGVHPNGGYYSIDVEGIVTAYEHGIVFTKEDIDILIATNRDFMWNGEIKGAKFKRIDGGKPDPRWPDTPGVLWTSLIFYDETLRKIFEANHKPDSWSGLKITPWYFTKLKELQK